MGNFEAQFFSYFAFIENEKNLGKIRLNRINRVLALSEDLEVLQDTQTLKNIAQKNTNQLLEIEEKFYDLRQAFLRRLKNIANHQKIRCLNITDEDILKRYKKEEISLYKNEDEIDVQYEYANTRSPFSGLFVLVDLYIMEGDEVYEGQVLAAIKEWSNPNKVFFVVAQSDMKINKVNFEAQKGCLLMGAMFAVNKPSKNNMSFVSAKDYFESKEIIINEIKIEDLYFMDEVDLDSGVFYLNHGFYLTCINPGEPIDDEVSLNLLYLSKIELDESIYKDEISIAIAKLEIANFDSGVAQTLYASYQNNDLVIIDLFGAKKPGQKSKGDVLFEAVDRKYFPGSLLF